MVWVSKLNFDTLSMSPILKIFLKCVIWLILRNADGYPMHFYAIIGFWAELHLVFYYNYFKVHTRHITIKQVLIIPHLM